MKNTKRFNWKWGSCIIGLLSICLCVFIGIFFHNKKNEETTIKINTEEITDKNEGLEKKTESMTIEKSPKSDTEIKSEDNTYSQYTKEELFRRLQALSDMEILEEFCVYEDFDGNGSKEMFAITGIPIEGRHVNGQGQIWLIDEEKEICVEAEFPFSMRNEIGIIQFGNQKQFFVSELFGGDYINNYSGTWIYEYDGNKVDFKWYLDNVFLSSIDGRPYIEEYNDALFEFQYYPIYYHQEIYQEYASKKIEEDIFFNDTTLSAEMITLDIEKELGKQDLKLRMINIVSVENGSYFFNYECMNHGDISLINAEYFDNGSEFIFVRVTDGLHEWKRKSETIEKITDISYSGTTEEFVVDAEKEVLRIREKWTEVQNQISVGKLEKSEPFTGVDYYLADGEIKQIIETGLDMDGNKYSWTYFFDNEKLIFSYYCSDISEERLYFFDDQLFRQRKTTANGETINYDNLQSNTFSDHYIEYYTWEREALLRGYHLRNVY